VGPDALGWNGIGFAHPRGRGQLTCHVGHGMLREMGRIRKPPKAKAPLVALTQPRWDAPGSSTFEPEPMGEQELEVIRRLLEKQEPKSIRNDMGITAPDLDQMFAQPRFQREYELQTKLADRSIRVRMERLAGEALDVVRDVMRTAVSPGNRLRAAVEILDRSGYVKIEKRLTVTADAESIIRELNRLGAAGDVPHTTQVSTTNGGDDIENAEFTEIGAAVADAVAKGRLDIDA
jgi:hypothetical protein